jgi:hypothetical protein
LIAGKNDLPVAEGRRFFQCFEKWPANQIITYKIDAGDENFVSLPCRDFPKDPLVDAFKYPELQWIFKPVYQSVKGKKL